MTGCANPPPTSHLPVPATLLTYAAEPEVPADGADDAGLADWILGLRKAGAECRSRLAAVRGILAAR